VPEGVEEAEVVCVLRPVHNPYGEAKVVVLSRATPEFMAQLEKAQALQDSRSSTSMTLPHRSPASSASPDTQTPSSGRSIAESSQGWRSARREPLGGKEYTPNRAPSFEPVLESARWEKHWAAGTSSSNDPIRR
jgi:hypothetical protein